MVYGFQQTAITPALPVVRHELGASREWTSWLLSGYFIVASVAPLLLGKVADRFGKRRIYLLALAIFTVGSIGAAFAPSIGLLVMWRLVQGAGGAVFPLSFSILRDELPQHRIGPGIGVLTGGFGLGAAAGFGVGGLITEFASWRWVFGVGAIALIVAIGLVWAIVPANSVRTPRRLDTPGALLFGAAIAALIIALTEGPSRGWASPLAIGLFVVAAAAVCAWLLRELRTSDPLMDLTVLASRPVLFTNIVSMVSGYSVIGVNILVPFLLTAPDSGAPDAAFGLTAGPLLTGIVLLPRAFGQSAGGPVTGRISRWIGPGNALAVSLLLAGIGAAGLAFARGTIWLILAELAVVGVGFGLSISTGSSLVTLAAAPDQTSIAASINSVLRRVGGGIGAQIAAALLAADTVAGSGEPSSRAFTVAFALAGIVAVAGAVLALLIRPDSTPAR
nr:MFS transporter [Spelaeicoccus albus]